MKCPCCGSEVPNVPVEAFKEIALGFASRELLNELVRRYPRGATRGELLFAIYHGQEPETAAELLRNMASNLRKLLKPYGWAIPANQPGRGNGVAATYRLAPIKETP